MFLKELARLNGMKSLFRKVIINIRPISQIVILILIGFMPSWLNLSEIVVEQLNITASQKWIDYIFYVAWALGDMAIGTFFVVMALLSIRKMNKDKVFNKGDAYKNYPYIWYWLCAKILGYLECNLILVPIFMQFKLVIRDTFDKYYCGSFIKKDYETITVKRENISNVMTSVNLLIADTYPLDINQLPENKIENPTITISRDNVTDHNRYYSPSLVKAVVNEISNLPNTVKVVHIFATTNPQNTVNIVRNAFKLGERGSLDKIVVYQQSAIDPLRRFQSNGKVVYVK